jgi:hypothetical protein
MGTGGNGETAAKSAQASLGAVDLLMPPTLLTRPTDWYLDRIRRGAQRRRGTGLPNYRPMTRSQLVAAKVTRVGLRDNFERVEAGVYVSKRHLLPEKTDSGFTRTRRVPAATLVRAHALAHPGHIATGFAAAAEYGMTYFVEEETLEFLVSRGAGCANSAPHLQLTRTRRLAERRARAFAPDPVFPDLWCVEPSRALARMLQVLDGEDADRSGRWRVPDLATVLPHLTPSYLRQVQVSDAFHQTMSRPLPADPRVLVSTGLVSADLVGAVLGATDVGAESPPETLLRLVVADLAPGLRTQIPVFRDSGALLTTADMGWEKRRVFLFYDGAHHQLGAQRDHDSEVLAQLQRHGGQVFRITAGQLADADGVAQLRDAVAEALGL